MENTTFIFRDAEGDIEKEVTAEIIFETGNPAQLNWPGGEATQCIDCKDKYIASPFNRNILTVQWPLLQMNPVPPGLVSGAYLSSNALVI